MRTVLILLALTQFSGCVVVTTKYKPGEMSTVCYNITICRKE